MEDFKRPERKQEDGAAYLVGLDDDRILPVREGILLDIGIQLIAPAQATGFAGPPPDTRSNDRPVSRPIRLHAMTCLKSSKGV